MRAIHLIRSLLFALVMLCVSAGSSAQLFVSLNFGPPALPVYEQPLCPAEGYMWAPGYWASTPAGYFWVPGTWVLAPEPGLLWTPGYWAFDDGLYFWHPGYWDPVVGYYGGIDYGFGYPGTGYYGGYWRGRQFYYNQTVNNVSTTTIHNVYNTTVVNNVTTVNRVSYNGGPGGTTARPAPEQQAAARQRHVPPTSVQTQHEHAASTNQNLLASVNKGRPPIAATPKPAEFSGRGVVAARQAGAPYKAPENRAPENRAAPPRPSTPTARPENKPENRVPRPETEPRRATPAPRPEEPRPPSTPEKENAPRPGIAPRPESAPRPENAPRPEREARPETAPRPMNAPHPEREARPENAPHPGKEPPPNKKTPPDKEQPPPPNGEEQRPH